MRAIERKRPPLMTARRWFVLIVFIIVALCVWGSFYYRDIKQPRWNEFSAARELAINTAELSSADQLYKHVWEETTWITEGVDYDDRAVFVFLRGEDLLHTIYADNVISAAALKERFSSANAGATIIRISPGMFRDRPVWEVYYRSASEGSKRYYYDFYTFDEAASLIDSYTLTGKTGP